MPLTEGEVILEAFKAHGIEYVFCSPGSEWVPVWEGLAKLKVEGDTALKYINCRHENLAVSAALGYAKVTGRLPAVLLHANVGALNASMVVRTAQVAEVPMIICGGDTSRYGENSKIGPHWLNRLSNIGRSDSLVRPFVKWSNAVTSHLTLVDSIYRGCQIAQTPPKGPVFISVPFELMWEIAPELRLSQPYKPGGLPGPEKHDLEVVATQLINSKKPIIITEQAGKHEKTVTRLVELAELLSIPVFESTEPNFASFPPDHPLHLGYDVSEALKEADTVFVVAGNTPWHPPSEFPPKGTKVILLDENPVKARLPYWGFNVDLIITADVELWLTSLLKALKKAIPQSRSFSSTLKERYEYWKKKHDEMRKRWAEEALAGRGKSKPISNKWFMYQARKLLPANSVMLSECITHEESVRNYLAAPQRFVKAQGGGLGIGLGVTAGVKLAHPDEPVVLFVGDGSFNYNPVVAGLGLCQQYQIPIMVIILNNGCYLSMRRGFKRLFPAGCSVKNEIYFGTEITPAMDYVSIARAFGAYAERLENSDDIEPAMTRALKHLKSGEMVLLDVVMD